MNVEQFRAYCLSLGFVTEKMPFGPNVLVFYVGGKIFSLANIEEFQWINVKCEPEKALELRADFSEVQPGYHMNKKHWNSLSLIGSLKDSQIKEWIKDSYELVYQSLPKKVKDSLL